MLNTEEPNLGFHIRNFEESIKQKKKKKKFNCDTIITKILEWLFDQNIGNNTHVEMLAFHESFTGNSADFNICKDIKRRWISAKEIHIRNCKNRKKNFFSLNKSQLHLKYQSICCNLLKILTIKCLRHIISFCVLLCLYNCLSVSAINNIRLEEAKTILLDK